MASDQSPRANVQVLRNLFNDKDILPMRMLRSGDLHPSLTKEPAGTETSPPPPSGVRIPRPTLAPKPSRPALPTVSIRVQQPTSVRNDGTDNSPSSTRERADRRSPKPDAIHAPSPPPPATPKKSPDVAKPRLLPVVSLCRKKDGQGTADERLCKKDSSPKENYCPKGGYLSRREYISDAGYASRKGSPSNSDSRLDKSSVSNEDSLSRGSLDLPEASDSGSVRSSSGSGRRSDGGERESTWRRRSLPPPTSLPAPPKPPRTDAMRLPPGLTPPPQDARLGDLAQRERPPGE